MNLSNSNLFKEFARPVLQQQHNKREEDCPAKNEGVPNQDKEMDTIFQFLLNRSKLEVALVHIIDATKDAYTIKVETRVSGTGPVSSTVSAMELDMCYDGVSFSKLKLPEFKTQPGGTMVVVPEQVVRITDMATYMAYVKSIITSSGQTSFQLANGHCRVRALGITAQCAFQREFSIPSMDGPRGRIKDLRRDGEDIAVTLECLNPSPVEIDQGVSLYEVRNAEGACVAVVKGPVKIARGQFEVVLTGKMKPQLEPGTKTASERMGFFGIGLGEGRDHTWCDSTSRFVEMEVDVKPEFIKLLTEGA